VRTGIPGEKTFSLGEDPQVLLARSDYIAIDME
jgi:hypothetical protein